MPLWCVRDPGRQAGAVGAGAAVSGPSDAPSELEAAEACVPITVPRWPDGWSHGTDSIRQVCDDAPQCVQAARSGSDHILMDGLAAKGPRSGFQDSI